MSSGIVGSPGGGSPGGGSWGVNGGMDPLFSKIQIKYSTNTIHPQSG